MENFVITITIMEKSRKLKVINLQSKSKYFSWNDGLFAIEKEVDGVLHLWKIKDGLLARYDNLSQ